MRQHVARKRFGQHFLHDTAVIRRILQAVAPKPGETLVEIGPGLGALTVPLLDQVEHLHVVELDRDVIPHLEAVCHEHGQLDIHVTDALAFDYRQLATPGKKIRLVGNLPYNISTPLLFHLLEQGDVIDDMHFMLQKEVVDRMVAQAGDKAYGRLSVSLAVHADVTALFDVGRGAFSPPPQVESTVVRLVPRAATFDIADMKIFSRLVTAAFSQRRKTLGNALRELMPRQAIEQAGIDPQLRAERITPEQYALLANSLLPGAAESRQG